MNNERKYIGDGVYVGFDGWHVYLETERAIGYTDRIFLGPEEFEEFVKFSLQFFKIKHDKENQID